MEGRIDSGADDRCDEGVEVLDGRAIEVLLASDGEAIGKAPVPGMDTQGPFENAVSGGRGAWSDPVGDVPPGNEALTGAAASGDLDADPLGVEVRVSSRAPGSGSSAAVHARCRGG